MNINSRSECECQVKGFSGAVYKKFKSLADAQIFICDEPQLKRLKCDEDFNHNVPSNQSHEDAKALAQLNK